MKARSRTQVSPSDSLKFASFVSYAVLGQTEFDRQRGAGDDPDVDEMS
jgi:hypothetical protein